MGVAPWPNGTARAREVVSSIPGLGGVVSLTDGQLQDVASCPRTGREKNPSSAICGRTWMQEQCLAKKKLVPDEFDQNVKVFTVQYLKQFAVDNIKILFAKIQGMT